MRGEQDLKGGGLGNSPPDVHQIEEVSGCS